MADTHRPDQPATKADLDALEARLDRKLDDVEQRLTEKTQEFVRDNQTEILRAFARYSEGENVRLRKLEADHSNLNFSSEKRFDNLEERLRVLEMKWLRGESPPA